MTQNAKQGWSDETQVYTTIKNVTKNSKLVFSMLGGIELGPGQELDLRTAFRKSQVVDAAHEIASLIRTGHLVDTSVAEGAAQPVPASGMPTADEMKKRAQAAKIRDVADCTSVSMLDDWMKDKDPQVALAAKIRYDIITGVRDEDGKVIPGREEEAAGEAKPTELIRSGGSAEQAPAVAGAGLVQRAQ